MLDHRLVPVDLYPGRDGSWVMLRVGAGFAGIELRFVGADLPRGAEPAGDDDLCSRIAIAEAWCLALRRHVQTTGAN